MRTKVALVVAFGLTLSVAPVHAYPGKSIAFNGSEAGTYVSADFSFFGGEDSLDTEYGVDTLGGQRITQAVEEYYDSGDSCTASDGTIGELFYLSEALGVVTYFNGGQVFVYSVDGGQCISLSTGVLKGSFKFVILGGTGKFTGASGSGTDYFTGVQLAAPSYPGSGFFGQVQDVFSGTITP